MKFKRSLAFLLALVMVLSLTGLSTFATTARAADKQYLSFSDSYNNKAGWYMSTGTSDAVLELYEVTSGRVGTRISSVSDISSGDQFIIFAQTGARIVHNYENAGTAQDMASSGTTITAGHDADIWTFTIGDNGGYTITNGGYYLTDQPYAGQNAVLLRYNELQISQTVKTEFNVEAVPNQSGQFYLTTGGEPIKPVVPPQFVAFTASGLGGKANGGWYMSADKYAVRLYKLNGSTGTPASEITSGGSYLIHNGTTHVMNNFFSGSAMQGGTAQSGKTLAESITDTESNDYWTIKETGSGTYTISPTSYPNYYLNDTAYTGSGTLANFTELAVTTNLVEFKITAATDAGKQGDGWFYIYTGDLELPNPQETDDLDGFGTGVRAAMFGASPDNTWVFTGGANVAGGFEQTKGEHNFTRHFEEYVRWQYPAYGGEGQSVNTLQRYVFNSGAKGRTLSDIVTHWQTAVSNYDPKAVLYMAGPEDFKDEQFEAHLKSFIDNGLGLRNGAGYVVILTPINDNTHEASTITDSIKNVLKTNYKDDSTKKAKILLLDIFNTITQTSGMYTDGGYLTEAGHYAIGEKLCNATIGHATNYPSKDDYRKNTSGRQVNILSGAPQTFDTAMPTATAGNGSLRVEIEDAQGPFTYELEVGGKTVKGTATGSPFTILGLPESGDYTLITRTNNGANQLVTVQGSLASGAQSHKYAQDVAGTPAETIQNKFNGGDQMTWLFIGDSITHGAQHGHGYDSISEIFDKFLEAAGRGTDVVLNVGVSGAEAYTTNQQQFRNTIGNLDRRVNAFSNAGIDVATIQLGTNDSASATLYKGYIKTIMDAIWAISDDAVIVLRTPTAAPGGNYSGKAARYAGVLQELASENSGRVIYEDQYSAVASAMNTYTWIKSDSHYIFGDANVHPGPVGHLIMANQFMRACGIYTPDNPITNLKYEILNKNTASGTPTINQQDAGDGNYNLTVTSSGLSSTYGELTLSATNTALNETFEITADTIGGLTLTVPNGTYEVTVSGVRSGNVRYQDKTNSRTVEAGTFTPAKPTDEDLAQVNVTVTCDNEFDIENTEGKTFTLSQAEGGAQVGEVQNSGGTYTCEVTVTGSAYATKFDATHHVEGQDQTVTFRFENNTWVATTTTVTVNVACDASPELSLETVNDQLTVAVAVDGVEGTEDYELEDGDITIDSVNSTETGFTAQVNFHPEVIANRYAADNGINVGSFSATPTSVAFTYNDGTWIADPSTVTIGITTATTPTPPTPPTPPSTVTPPVGDDDTELPDDDVPLNPTPDDDTDIEDGDTPLAPAPEDKGDTDIPDGDTPLDSTPKTGDTSIAVAVLWSIFSMSSLGFVWVVLSMKKSGKHSK